MASVTYDRVTKRFAGGTLAVKELSLEIKDTEFMVLVGPSGCGKSTALRMLAGLEEISEGVVRIGEKVVNELDPRERDIAMVFQNYALYPNMTVADNIGFGLRMRKIPKAERQPKVRDAARLLGLSDYDMFCTYSILESPMGVENYVATLRLTPVTDGDQTFAEWTAEFDCAPERETELVGNIGGGVFQGGFDALKRAFGG